ncbi:putative acid phosphatase of HAD superfamily subfamily IIIB [Streptomyces sp. Amel2xB2]|uniref:HAD family acid phosphatase n=1 Tax=Streptomyces sp. Amel2xB2 TaxID=1305829 RepID=UPI000DBA5965|nr:HAD family acid phosphatase [Streptomyces sp. Amel2xB2]RAJ58895.1 putative acid phosphatase of HAD superfamily subfamily IIIB [Streptomyces sp. Amel2xB2]
MHGRKWTTRIAVSVAGAGVLTAASVAAGPAMASTDAPAPAKARTASGTSAAVTPEKPHTGAAHPAADDVDYDTWRSDVSKVTDEARPYLEKRIAQGDGEKMAVVFDIDNTTLETHFHPIWELPTPPVQQTLDLARYADSRGVAVYFVTARPGIIYSLTKDNLEKVGYPIAGLYVRDLPDIFDEVSKYKTAKRAEIEADGHTIIANIGNTPTDVVGGHTEKNFKLPDYDGTLS